jgi:putative CocE/NonD family hydrolase
VLVYTSEPIERDLTIVGEPLVQLHAASTAADTDFAVRLCAVDDAGTSRTLQEGIMRTPFREGRERRVPTLAGDVHQYAIGLGPIAAQLPRGWRVRLQVKSSDFPLWDRNLNSGSSDPTTSVVATQTVLHDDSHPSCLTLPVVQT